MKIKKQSEILEVQTQLGIFLKQNRKNLKKVCVENGLKYNTVYKWFYSKNQRGEYYPIHVENVNTIIKLVNENASFNKKSLTIK